jgi:hypothetical protein
MVNRPSTSGAAPEGCFCQCFVLASTWTAATSRRTCWLIAAAEREGLSPRLYQQAMHMLDLPRAYRTIFVCGGLGLGGDRERDREALRRMRRHLAPGGVLVFDHHMPYGVADHWSYWIAEKRRELPESPRPRAEGRLTSDRSEIAMRARIVALDPLEQQITLAMRAERRPDGQLVAESTV